MSEHRIQLDTLDARWGRYRALISRSDQLQRKRCNDAIIGHRSDRTIHYLFDHTLPLSAVCVRRSTGSMCMYIGHVYVY